MKKNKLFLLPITTIVAATTTIVPILASCSKPKEKKTEDYTISMEDTAKTVTTDLYYNENIDEQWSEGKNYVEFKATLNQPVQITKKDGAVSEIVGLPWINSKNVKITLNSKFADVISIDPEDVYCYAVNNGTDVKIYVPYSFSKEITEDPHLLEEELCNISLKINFYKGTAQQYQENKMEEISTSVDFNNLKIINKNTQFVKYIGDESIQPTQNQQYYPLKFELDKDVYQLRKTSSWTNKSIWISSDHEAYNSTEIRVFGSSVIDSGLVPSQYKPKIEGNILTVYIVLSDLLLNCNASDKGGFENAYYGAVSKQDTINIRFECNNMVGDLDKSWTVTQEVKVDPVELNDKPETRLINITTPTVSISGSGVGEIKAELKTPLTENQILQVLMIPSTATDKEHYNAYSWNWSEFPIRTYILCTVRSSDIDNKKVKLPIIKVEPALSSSAKYRLSFQCWEINGVQTVTQQWACNTGEVTITKN